MKKSLIMVILLSGCASPGIDRADQNQVVKRYYASVESMQKVTLSSEVGTGIAAGAGFGFVDSLDGNKEEMIGGAIVGGLVGGLLTALFEGGNTAYQYNLYAADEGEFTVIQKKKLDKNTKCVLVNAANKVTLSTTDTSICEKSIKYKTSVKTEVFSLYVVKTEVFFNNVQTKCTAYLFRCASFCAFLASLRCCKAA